MRVASIFAVGAIVFLFSSAVKADESPTTRSAEAVQRPHITGLSHIALYVHDMDKTRAFYKDFLGFAEPYHINNKDGTLHLTWIKINDRQTLELFPEKEANSDRLYHIALETDDAVGMRDYLAAHGVKVPGKVARGESGT